MNSIQQAINTLNGYKAEAMLQYTAVLTRAVSFREAKAALAELMSRASTTYTAVRSWADLEHMLDFICKHYSNIVAHKEKRLAERAAEDAAVEAEAQAEQEAQQDMRPRIRIAYIGKGVGRGIEKYRIQGTVAVLYSDNIWQELERMAYSSRYPNTRDAVRRSITLGASNQAAQ